LARGTQLAEAVVSDVIGRLHARNLVDLEGTDAQPSYRITGEGIQFVQQIESRAGVQP
jgi:hypothetical protein